MTTTSANTATAKAAEFRIVNLDFMTWSPTGAYVPGYLPIPVKRHGAVQLAYFQLAGRWASVDETKEEAIREDDKVTPPVVISYGNPFTGERADTFYPDWRDEHPGNPKSHFGLPTPKSVDKPQRDYPTAPVIGHFSDPKWLPKDRLEILRKRIYEGLDTLLPFYADEHRPWTEDANKAAREVRDFFPIASEPGLWPYYRAEGKDFFAWLEKNAPPGKAALPWDIASP
ncbi:MAG: hypothetical protein U0441_31815 [Polyangiaceae bacterium]